MSQKEVCKDTNKIILGLDVSSKCIGVCLASYDNDGNVKLLEVTHCRPKVSAKIKGIEALFIKSKIFNDEFLTRFKKFPIDKVVIEEPLIGSNNSLTVATLLKFNAMISEGVYRELGIVPEYISSYDARKYAFPQLMSVRKYDKSGIIYSCNKIRNAIKKGQCTLFGAFPWDCEKKHILLDLVSERYPDIPWVYNKKNELKTENFDASDAVVCVLGYVNKERYPSDVEPKLLSWKENVYEEQHIFTYSIEFCGQIYEKRLEADYTEDIPD